MSNTDEKEKDEKEKSSPRPDKGLSNPPAKSPPKEHTLRATPLTEELPSTEASPYLSAISPKTKQPASRPVKTYPLPQRTTVLFGKSELSALEKEFQSAAPPKPPNITSNVPADVQNTPSPSTPLPTPTPAALKAQTSYTETLPPSQPLTPTKPSIGPGVLVTPSESLLSPEDYDDADPSETLSALLDEVFSEGVPDFEAMFLPPSALPPSSTKPPPPPLDLPSAPPWDPIATLAVKETQAQTPIPSAPLAPHHADPPPPASDFVIPSARHTTPSAPEPAASLFEDAGPTRRFEDSEPTKSLGNLLTTTLTELANEKDSPLLTPTPYESPTPEITTDLNISIAEALQKIPSPPPEPATPSFSFIEKETAPTPPLSLPIFHLSSPPSFVDPENQPPPPPTPDAHPLEETHEALPAPLWRLLASFNTDALLLCLATWAVLWVAKTMMGDDSWFSSAASWRILGPAGLSLLALLAFAYTSFFAIAWNGATPGRRLFGLQLVNKKGLPIGIVRALFRGFFSLFSFGLALSGFWWAIGDSRQQTFHDKCVGTFVIRVQPKKKPQQ